MVEVQNDYIIRKKRIPFSLVEWILVFIMVVILLSIGIWGFVRQGAVNRDEQRRFDIDQVVLALDNYYLNSSQVPSNRFFPIATCSQDTNEVDYELTARLALTGQIPEVSSHPYISNDTFPTDERGQYDQTLSDRALPYRCPTKLSDRARQGGDIYLDFPSCNFSSQGQKRNVYCYTYTSTNNGDTFRLGYFSESRNGFIILEKVRDGQLRELFFAR